MINTTNGGGGGGGGGGLVPEGGRSLEEPTDGGDGERHGHGHADEEGGQEDLGEEALGVPLGAVEPLDDEAVELA